MIYFSTLKETSFELYPSGSRMDQWIRLGFRFQVR
jgi:hypothetical protein